MARQSVGYHTRLYADNTQKVTGGIFGGGFDRETVERLVKAHFKVTVKPSGSVVFVDKQEREVTLYFTVHADETEVGRQALLAYREKQAALKREDEEREKREQAEIDDLISGLPHEEVLRRLKAL